MLRHITMLILKQQPMSGSELMNEIKEYTDWKPSPGSIYPLLSHLQEEKLIESHPDQDVDLRRFTLTEEGQKELEEHLRFDDQFRRRTKTIRRIYWRLHRKMPENVYNSLAALIDQIEATHQKTDIDPMRRTTLIHLLDHAREQLKALEEENDE